MIIETRHDRDEIFERGLPKAAAPKRGRHSAARTPTEKTMNVFDNNFIIAEVTPALDRDEIQQIKITEATGSTPKIREQAATLIAANPVVLEWHSTEDAVDRLPAFVEMSADELRMPDESLADLLVKYEVAALFPIDDQIAALDIEYTTEIVDADPNLEVKHMSAVDTRKIFHTLLSDIGGYPMRTTKIIARTLALTIVIVTIYITADFLIERFFYEDNGAYCHCTDYYDD